MGASVLIPSAIGEYRVTGFLGAGGMGEVYQAVYNRLGRTVAVKVLTNVDRSASFVERFVNEARIQASLHHPHIATLYDFFEYGGRPCIIMEYVDGQTLEARIRMQGRLPVAEALAVFRAVVDAVAYIHGHGIVHRDVKPSNVKISTRGEVKLLDFGIARNPQTPGLTRTGAVVGTPEYFAPEQIHGQRADARTDVWALGVLLYEMVTGRVPFEASSLVELYRRIDQADYPAPAALGVALPADVAALVAGCLRRRPSERFASAQALLREVERCVGATPQARVRPSLPPSHRPGPAPPVKLPDLARVRDALKPHARPLALAVAALGVVALLLLVVPWISPTPEPPPPPPDTPVQTITIDVVEGVADVYRGDQRLGQTPFRMQAHLGETIQLTLKRDGYKDKTLGFDVTPTKSVYTELMEAQR